MRYYRLEAPSCKPPRIPELTSSFKACIISVYRCTDGIKLCLMKVTQSPTDQFFTRAPLSDNPALLSDPDHKQQL